MMIAVYTSFRVYVSISMVIIKLRTIFKYSIVYIKYKSRRNDLINIDVVDLDSSK